MISIEVNKPTFKFNAEEERVYSIIGYVLSRLSSLEYSLDEFMFTMSENHPTMTTEISSDYPRTYYDKIDFLVDSIIRIPKLRECGDGAGLFDLNIIAYGLEETLAFRNVFIHGTISLIEVGQDHFVCDVKKYTQVKGRRRRVAIDTYRYSSLFLERVIDHCRYFEVLILHLVSALNGQDVARQLDQIRKGQIRVRELSRLLGDLGLSDVDYAA